ncbi:MAG: tRNA (5-methylaminomethyl-2-thiouridylate)-methyltransferase [Pseudomonadota bacterium]
MPKAKRAVALISGGLDSMLAARVVMEQGVEVEGVNFFTGFCVEGHTHAIRETKRATPKRNNALWVAEQLGIRLHIVDVIEEYKDVLLNPRHGYGANLNPCLDCKVFMVRKAAALLTDREGPAGNFMTEHGFDFIITGEVIGQRPKSQRKATMPLIASESGADDLLLRPLCARLLEPTLPEREGWVDRDKLYDFHGRSRKPQITLAESFGFDDWSQPAGGCCFLTNPQYSNKLVDLWEARGSRDYELDDVMLLKVGRHLRPAPHFKLIIGREEGENRYLEGYRNTFIALTPLSHNGPLCLIDGDTEAEDLTLAAQILGRYTQGRDADEVVMTLSRPDGTREELRVAPMGIDDIQADWHVGG